MADGSLALADLDIDGGTDIGAAIVDADLFIVDDGAGGTNRKVTASRIKTYAGGAALANDGNNRVVTGDGSGGLNGEANLTFDGTDLTVGAGTIIVEDCGAKIGGANLYGQGATDAFYTNVDDVNTGMHLGDSDRLYLITGGNQAVNIDANGHVTLPLQPCFSGNIGTEQANFAINSWTTMTFDTEIFDLNADYNTGTYTFTAPVAGKYIFSCNLQFNNLDYDSTYWQSQLKTSNREYPMLNSGNQMGANPTNLGVCLSVIADLDAADTAYMRFYQGGGTAEADLRTESYFTGCLLA